MHEHQPIRTIALEQSGVALALTLWLLDSREILGTPRKSMGHSRNGEDTQEATGNGYLPTGTGKCNEKQLPFRTTLQAARIWRQGDSR